MIEAEDRGATLAEWAHFGKTLGLKADLLPVVSDPDAVPDPNSAIKQFGKIPSMYNAAGYAHGLKDWQKRAIEPHELNEWAKDRRLSLCVRSQAVRAIDVDITDPATAEAVRAAISAALRDSNSSQLPERFRGNSSKFLQPFRMSGDWAKRQFPTFGGKIEFLASGQQFLLAGMHESGVRYEWQDGLPAEIPELSAEQFEYVWAVLVERFATEKPAPEPKDSTTPNPSSEGLLTEISDDEQADLDSAMHWPPLLKTAAANEVWSEIGYALLSLGKHGAKLWLELSRRADNYAEGAAELWWAEHINQIPRSDFRHIFTMARKLGWGTKAALEDFPVVVIPDALDAAFEVQSSAHAALKNEAIPDVVFSCTDQMNAKRIAAHFGHKLVSLPNGFHVFDGKRWVKSESEAARCVAHLSQIVNGEAKAVRAKLESLLERFKAEDKETYDIARAAPRPEHSAAYKKAIAKPDIGEVLKLAEQATALEKWAKACAMESTQAKATIMVRRLLDVDLNDFDQKHHLLNCNNGTVDLRTGELHAHDPKDFITQLAPTNYVADAEAPAFRTFLDEILDRERAAFLQRWFGYCVTGDTREQKLVLHIGKGSNGKGTLFRLLDAVLGSYSHTAAPALLTAQAERHPTDIADLFGRRLVVAHESDEGSVLREGFIKQASGEDKLSGRFLFKDFFTFQPTFKLQLLTNHDPIVKGADFGIWRRLLLVKYTKKYGTAAEVESGIATDLGDNTLTARLTDESEGILRWLVDGAREFYRVGLAPPARITADSGDYRKEQDRMLAFVTDSCATAPSHSAPVKEGFGALYPAYSHWCKASGYQPLGVNKFSGEIMRVVPGSRVVEVNMKTAVGYRRRAMLQGVTLNIDDGSAFPIVSSNEDLL